jgi:hypothetical protein
MDFTTNPRPLGPGRPVPGGSSRPGSVPGMPERRMFTDFGPRPMASAARPAAPGSIPPRPLPSAPAPPAASKPTSTTPPKPFGPHAPLAPKPVPQVPRPMFQPQTAPVLTASTHPGQPHHQPPHHPKVSHTTTYPTHHALQHTPQAPGAAAALNKPGAAHPGPAAAPLASHQQASATAPQGPHAIPPLPHTPISTELKAGKPHNASAHTGLVGFLCFIILGGLLLSPLLPSKIFDNFPGSSVSVSSGEQTLACLDDPLNATSVTSYHGKFGSPLNYKYATTTVQHATCDGKQQSADIGHMSQFSPLALAIDALLALGVAIGIAQIWRLIFARRQD